MPSKGIRVLREPQKAKFVCGMLFNDYCKLDKASVLLEKEFGPIEVTSFATPFEVTDYYSKEIGVGIRRLFIAFRDLVEQDLLSQAKVLCQLIELKLANHKKRSVNIDPGIVTAERLVLATSKNFTHRIYIGKGVHADLTLIFQGKSFVPLPWTFADYSNKEAIQFWNLVRSLYMSQRNNTQT